MANNALQEVAKNFKNFNCQNDTLENRKKTGQKNGPKFKAVFDIPVEPSQIGSKYLFISDIMSTVVNPLTTN